MALETLLAGAKLLSKPLEDLYALAKEKARPRVVRWHQAKHINTLYKKIDSIQKVKTIWQIDKEVKLMAFFYPSRVIVEGQARTVTRIDELPASGNSIIQGIVGQGKSIFLRYLCIRTLKEGKKIPVFFELRRVEKGQTLRRHVYAVLKSLGFEVDEELFDLYASSGKFVFLLDAFDELDSELVTGVVNELELLSNQYPALKMIVTSRPDSGIERSPHFRVFRLAPLEQSDFKPFLDKIVPEPARVKELLQAIESSKPEIKDLLRTPLMLTLLVIVYKADQRIPSSLPEFYENLFQTLLVRHDATKAGFSRKRHCALNDAELKLLFEAFCFIAKQKGTLVLTLEQFNEHLNIASKFMGIQCDQKGFQQDITKVACLMQEEGFRYHFIHQSVLEFNAASFIRHSPDDLARKFYTKLPDAVWHNWEQELVFLAQIDKYRYSKYFLAPSLRDTLDQLSLSPTEAKTSVKKLYEVLRNCTLEIGMHEGRPTIHGISLLPGYGMRRLEHVYLPEVIKAADPAQNANRLQGLKQRVEANPNASLTISLGDWLKEAGTLEQLQPSLESGLKPLITELQSVEAYIAREDSKENLLTLN